MAAAQSNVAAAGGDVASAQEQAASIAAVAYVRALRSVAVVGARAADSALAAELVQIARDQLSAGVGVALDVTRAQSQLASSRAQLIVARNDRDRSLLDLRRALNIDLDTPLQLTDSLEVPESEVVENQTSADRRGNENAAGRARPRPPVCRRAATVPGDLRRASSDGWGVRQGRRQRNHVEPLAEHLLGMASSSHGRSSRAIGEKHSRRSSRP